MIASFLPNIIEEEETCPASMLDFHTVRTLVQTYLFYGTTTKKQKKVQFGTFIISLKQSTEILLKGLKKLLQSALSDIKIFCTFSSSLKWCKACNQILKAKTIYKLKKKKTIKRYLSIFTGRERNPDDTNHG